MTVTKTVNGVEIKILQGYNEIGGNCIVIKDKDSEIVFDQGIRFSRFRKFYNTRIQPLSPQEMKELGIIPPSDEYKKIFISHYHLDHLGLLFHLPPDAEVYVPDTEILEKFLEPYKNSPGWTTYVPPSVAININNAISNQDNVIPFYVEHSAYPAVAYYLNNPNVRILYTGDFRLTSPIDSIDSELHSKIHNKLLLKEITAKGYSTDVLIIEGTNFSSPSTPTNEYTFNNIVFEIFNIHKNSLIMVLLDPLDVEAIFTILHYVNYYGRKPVITNRRLLKMIDYWTRRFGWNKEIYQLLDENFEQVFEVVDEEELTKSQSEYVILTAKDEPIELARKLKNLEGTVVISLSTETKSESGEDESVEDVWFKTLGFIVYRLRISGHYYPYELRDILDTIKPKYVIPVHTEASRTVCEFVKRFGYQCL
ncbi:hypothetical protein SJAV_09230 [Sulfurisphaera javensis]|uniref:Metallo-beta-lactamase domain-containing protein n=1 Tax=Sulfurisphaera javensis TaxID=2049879 RepID=A0AAT9GQ85_9CREN